MLVEEGEGEGLSGGEAAGLAVLVLAEGGARLGLGLEVLRR